MLRRRASRWDPVSISKQPEPVPDAVEGSAAFIETMTPWIAALSMIRKDAIEAGLPPDVADDLVRGAMKMWEES